MLFKVTLFLMIVSVVLFIITQIIIPTTKSTKLFPMFRATRSKLEEELAEVNSKLEEEQLAKEIKFKKSKLDKTKETKTT